MRRSRVCFLTGYLAPFIDTMGIVAVEQHLRSQLENLYPAAAMGIVTKWAIRLQTVDFYGPSPSTPRPPLPPTLAPPPRCWPPPPLRADFCSLTRLHALPLYHALLWKMGNGETYDMENMDPPPLSVPVV